MMTGVSLARIALISSEPMPGNAEDLLGDDRAAEDRRHLQRDQRHHRDQRVAHDVLDDDDALAEALGARRGHVVEADDVEHRGAHVARHRRPERQPEHRDRHDRLAEVLPEPAPAGLADVGPVDERQPVELDAEDQDQQQAGEEGRQREADEGEASWRSGRRSNRAASPHRRRPGSRSAAPAAAPSR